MYELSVSINAVQCGTMQCSTVQDSSPGPTHVGTTYPRLPRELPSAWAPRLNEM